jgi:protease stability complex PrcB-like protein
MRCVASLVLLLASCTACAAVGVAVPFATLAKGLSSGVAEPAQLVVRSPTDWVALWGRHTRTQTAPPPPVDFARDMVVALFLGERPTGGYAVEITQIERTDASLSIRYRTTRPDPSAIRTQALTQPFHLIKLPRADGPVTFIAESASR